MLSDVPLLRQGGSRANKAYAKSPVLICAGVTNGVIADFGSAKFAPPERYGDPFVSNPKHSNLAHRSNSLAELVSCARTVLRNAPEKSVLHRLRVTEPRLAHQRQNTVFSVVAKLATRVE